MGSLRSKRPSAKDPAAIPQSPGGAAPLRYYPMIRTYTIALCRPSGAQVSGGEPCPRGSAIAPPLDI